MQIKEMVPKLRFKDDNGQEFPEWDKLKLSDIAHIKRGAGSQYITYMDDSDDSIRMIRISDFHGDREVYVKKTKEIERFKIRQNDILIAGTGATAGITHLVPEKFSDLAFSYNAPRIRLDSNNDVKFIYFYLKSNLILSQQRRLFTGNAQPFLDTKSIGSFKLIS